MGKHCINPHTPPLPPKPSSDMYSDRHKSRLKLHTQIMSHSNKGDGFQEVRGIITALFPTATGKGGGGGKGGGEKNSIHSLCFEDECTV